MNIIDMINIHPVSEQRHTMNGTSVAAHGGVISPCNRITIARRCYALPYTTADAPFTVFN